MRQFYAMRVSAVTLGDTKPTASFNASILRDACKTSLVISTQSREGVSMRQFYAMRVR